MTFFFFILISIVDVLRGLISMARKLLFKNGKVKSRKNKDSEEDDSDE